MSRWITGHFENNANAQYLPDTDSGSGWCGCCAPRSPQTLQAEQHASERRGVPDGLPPSRLEPPVRLSVATGRKSPSHLNSHHASHGNSAAAIDHHHHKKDSAAAVLSARNGEAWHHKSHGNGSRAAAHDIAPPRHSSPTDQHRHRIHRTVDAVSARHGEAWQCPVCKTLHPAGWQVCPKDRYVCWHSAEPGGFFCRRDTGSSSNA